MKSKGTVYVMVTNDELFDFIDENMEIEDLSGNYKIDNKTDFTLCGSRSGANAVAVWMILMTYGSEGWKNEINALIKRADYLCEELDKLNVKYFRNPYMNIVTIEASQLSQELVKKYYLVADNYQNPKWYKIVVMDHVKQNLIDGFLTDFKIYYEQRSAVNK